MPLERDCIFGLKPFYHATSKLGKLELYIQTGGRPVYLSIIFITMPGDALIVRICHNYTVAEGCQLFTVYSILLDSTLELRSS